MSKYMVQERARRPGGGGGFISANWSWPNSGLEPHPGGWMIYSIKKVNEFGIKLDGVFCLL